MNHFFPPPYYFKERRAGRHVAAAQTTFSRTNSHIMSANIFHNSCRKNSKQTSSKKKISMQRQTWAYQLAYWHSDVQVKGNGML